MEKVKVSVCIPVYNGERFIKEAIESVLNQTYSDFEVIIVDNQSIDNTVNIIKSYNDPRIKFFQNSTNIGLIPNWNMALSKATGEYIKVLPADDIMYKECLMRQVPVLENDTRKEISLVCSKKQVIDERGRVLLTRGFSRGECRVPGRVAINKNIRSGGNIIGEGGAVLFRREIIEKTGGFNSEFYYVLDINLWYKILLHGDLYFVPYISSAFRVSSTSESTVIKDSQRSDLWGFNNMLFRKNEYGITYYSLMVGRLTVYLSTIVKKLVYRFMISKR